jgi:hypothetical protein
MKPLQVKVGEINSGGYCQMFFENGYGISIVSHKFSYGGDKGLLEIAVLKGTLENHELCYETDITDDVIGYLEPSEVGEYIERISALQ